MNEVDDGRMIRVAAPRNTEAKRTRTQEGDVLLTMTGALIGRVAPVTRNHAGAYVSQHVAILRMRDLQPEFVSWALSAEEGQQQIRRYQTGQTKPGLNFEQVKQLVIPHPPIKDERTFCELIKQRIAILGEQRIAAERVDSLFVSMRQRAFRGELDVSRVELAGAPNPPAASASRDAVSFQERYRRPGSFVAPAEIEQGLLAMEQKLEAGRGASLPWSEDYFKFRTLSQVLQPPFSFTKIWSAVEQDFLEPNYETVKEKLFEYVAGGILEQRFDPEQKEIVFSPIAVSAKS